jgi:hypothetical protein
VRSDCLDYLLRSLLMLLNERLLQLNLSDVMMLMILHQMWVEKPKIG